jgi:hypothetical protein
MKPRTPIEVKGDDLKKLTHGDILKRYAPFQGICCKYEEFMYTTC